MVSMPSEYLFSLSTDLVLDRDVSVGVWSRKHVQSSTTQRLYAREGNLSLTFLQN